MINSIKFTTVLIEHIKKKKTEFIIYPARHNKKERQMFYLIFYKQTIH